MVHVVWTRLGDFWDLGLLMYIKLSIVFQIEMDVHDSLVSRKGEAQKQLARDVLELSDCSLYQDVTLICSDGSLKLNSFLLAAVFPVFRDILVEVAHYEEEMAISLPSVVSDEIKNFFDELLKEELFYVGDSIKFLFLTSSKPISVNKSPDFNKKINVKEEDENDAKIEIFETEEKVNCDLEENLKPRDNKFHIYSSRKTQILLIFSLRVEQSVLTTKEIVIYGRS